MRTLTTRTIRASVGGAGFLTNVRTTYAMRNTPMMRSANANCSVGFIVLTLPLVVSAMTSLPKAEDYGQTWRGQLVNRSVGVSPRLAMQFCISRGALGGVGGAGLQAALCERVGKYWVAFPYGLLNYAAMDLLQLTPAQLRRAASLKERMEELEREWESLLGTSTTATPSRKLHWTQTPAGRARLARSVRRSWRTRHRSLKPTATSPARYRNETALDSDPGGQGQTSEGDS